MEKNNLQELRKKLKRGDMLTIAQNINRHPRTVYETMKGKLSSARTLKAVIDFLAEKKRISHDKAQKIKDLISENAELEEAGFHEE